MYITSLTLRNARALSSAVFNFANEPRVFLLVGVNGVGKSTSLDALRILLTNTLPLLSESRAKKENFKPTDIQNGADSLNAELIGRILKREIRFIIDAKRDRSVSEIRPTEQGADDQENDLVRNQAIETPDAVGLIVAPKDKMDAKLDNQALIDHLNYLGASRRIMRFPLAVFYSPHRSIIQRAKETKRRAAGGQALAYNEALLPNRNFALAEFAQWWKTQLVTCSQKRLNNLEAAFTEAVTTFLPECSNLFLDEENDTILITKSGKQVDVEQLSDGERSVLTLTLDLTRRLFITNPNLDLPTKKGVAIVLIDEIDMHLHPTWQRLIVERLEATFPKCQFIVTTHSPQVIGEVEPERISLIRTEGDKINVYPVEQSFGMDSNWILREIMDTDERDEDTKEMLNELFRHLARKDIIEAQRLIDTLKERLNGDTAQLQQAAGTIQRIKAIGR